MLDHISRGRLNFGIAASGIPTDWEMFQVDGMSGENREMTREAIDIILSIWSEKPGWSYHGKYWKAAVPNPMGMGLERHIRPLQQPHPPIGVAGLSAPSPTLELAGEHGWIPLSLNLNPGYLSSHWDSVETGAARAGRTVSRRDWRTVREVFVADTDEEAWRWSVDNMTLTIVLVLRRDLLLFCFDYADNPEPWRRSMELLATEVLPRVEHLTGA